MQLARLADAEPDDLRRRMCQRAIVILCAKTR